MERNDEPMEIVNCDYGNGAAYATDYDSCTNPCGELDNYR